MQQKGRKHLFRRKIHVNSVLNHVLYMKIAYSDTYKALFSPDSDQRKWDIVTKELHENQISDSQYSF